MKFLDDGDDWCAKEQFDKAIEFRPKSKSAYLARGIALSNLRICEEAVEDFTVVIGLHSNCAEAYSRRGLALFFIGDTKAAFDDFAQAIRMEPHNEIHFVNRAEAYWYINKWLAKKDLDKAIELCKTNAYIFHCRANVLDALNKKTEAFADFEQALRLDPHNED